MVERANSDPSSRFSRNTVPVAATRTVEAGRRFTSPVTCQPAPVAPSSKIGIRPRWYCTLAPSCCQVGVVALVLQVTPREIVGRQVRLAAGADGVPREAAVLPVDEGPLGVPVELPAALELEGRVALHETFQRLVEQCSA